ncbi:DUF2061 domain-containing protein [Pararhizobium mangrovi]|uniref:DUF2061 domain-containing protein n=1 Tax=Pararhizobium mangrovi TaxID=2590452 RepID=A0A506U251_9HYPH|nr:DUF2061 domain-containing protein [Pararhizobium mangrovi]
MTGLGYLFTGSLSAGGRLALVSMASGTVVYLVHERIWARVAWGRRTGSTSADRARAMDRLHVSRV